MLTPSGKKRVVETGKNILIVLLAAGALLLAGESGLLSQISPSFRIGSLVEVERREESGPVSEQRFSPAARPLTIAVTGTDGVRAGAKYGAGVDYLYERFAVNLGEALGSSKEPEEISSGEWEAALTCPGVFFDYQFEQDLAILSGWLSGRNNRAEISGRSARRICLAKDEESLTLYFIDGESGRFYRCETALSFAESVGGLLGGLQTRPARFAFESQIGAGIDPYFLLLDKMPELYSAGARAPLLDRSAIQAILAQFGMNIYIQPSASGDGGAEYAENDMRLIVMESGEVTFRGGRLSVSRDDENPGKGEIVEAVRKIAESCAGGVSGDALISLSGLSVTEGEQSFTVSFDYTLGGIPVRRDGADSAFVFEVRDGIIISAVMYLRHYTQAAEPVLVLPEAQEAGIVSASGGGEPVLTYHDRGETVSLNWFIRTA